MITPEVAKRVDAVGRRALKRVLRESPDLARFDAHIDAQIAELAERLHKLDGKDAARAQAPVRRSAQVGDVTPDRERPSALKAAQQRGEDRVASPRGAL